MITVKDLKRKIENLPDGMPVILSDLDDDSESGSYDLTDASMGVEPTISMDDEEEGEAFVISFTNNKPDYR